MRTAARGVSVAVEGGGQIGEFRVRSPSLATGYLDDETATAVGFVRDGELYPLARKDDVLNVAGRRISALEVEEGSANTPRSGLAASSSLTSETTTASGTSPSPSSLSTPSAISARSRRS